MQKQLRQAMDGAHLEIPRSIPEGFILGAAAASYQIEGAVAEGGRQPSIWDTFSRIPGAVVNGDTGDVACDHYHRYVTDVGVMKELGLDSYRFSVSWARVCPDGVNVNPEGLDFYSRLVDELLTANILPWLTLYHWDLPQALQDKGGWPSRDTAKRFVDYTMETYETLGDRVKVWTTLNEPWCSSFLSYTSGEHAPGHHSVEEGMLASHHLLLGHGWATKELRQENPSLNLGLTVNLTVAKPLDPNSLADQEAARLIDGQANRWFLDPLFRAKYPADTLEDFRQVDAQATEAFEAAILPGDMEAISAPIDTLGINYYQPTHVTAAWKVPEDIRQRLGITELKEPPSQAPATTRPTKSPMPAGGGITPESLLPRSAQNWEIDPLMLKELLLNVHRDYTGPAGTTMYVTENGAAMDDEVTEGPDGPQVLDPDREAYLALHLAATLDALDEGANVQGFFYWSLLDNYEWAWGYDKRFGIVRVDYETQERIIKSSGRLYSQIIRDRSLNIDKDAGRLVRVGSLVEGRD